MKKKLITSLVVGLMLGTTWVANAATINFSSYSSNGTNFSYLGNSLTIDEFNFSSSSSLGVWQNGSPYHPAGGTTSTSLMQYWAGATTKMTKVDNTPFQLLAIDLAPYGPSQYGTMNVIFSGVKSDHSTVKQTFIVNNSDGGTPLLQHFIFNEFSDLVSVNFTQGAYNGTGTAYQFNNLVVNQPPVPVPATLLLFGSGIVGLAGTRLRKKR